MRAMRLAFAGVWVAVAVGLLVRPVGELSAIGPLVALALVALNLARWRAERPRAVVTRRPTRSQGGQYHPEFDFGADADLSKGAG